jgi:ribonucleoside-diphosphate reductase alpha chain
LALQYGVPLKALIDKFSHMRFEPAGYTNNREIPIAKSIMDYIFRWLASKFLNQEDRLQVGLIERVDSAPAIVTMVSEHSSNGTATSSNGTEDHFTFRLQEDAPSCAECGALMIRNGACYKCLNCGATSGCS